MQINSMSSLYPSFLESTESSQSDVIPPLKNDDSASSPVKTKPSYDLHNMSLNEFKVMLKEKHDEGVLSSDDFVRLGTVAGLLEIFSGYSVDEKIDFLGVVQDDVDCIVSNPDNEGVEYYQKALDLLKGMDARLNARIPSFV